MLDLIVNTAREDERIRAVILNGSRADPQTPRDPFQDFDIFYIVTETASFRADPHWIDRFGERMILQMPEDMGEQPVGKSDPYSYLMQFMDGNRIDLWIFPTNCLAELKMDGPSIVLLDKDGTLAHFPATGGTYVPAEPTEKDFCDCCNEFWWVCAYVAKGLWRGQIIYAKHMAGIVREQLLKMITWYVGVRTGFKQNTGGFGKYIPDYLEPLLWERLKKSWCDAQVEHNWDALFEMGSLFRETGLAVAAHFGYTYPQGYDGRVSAHLRHVKNLPPSAREIY